MIYNSVLKHVLPHVCVLTVSYYVHNGTNVYGLLLDASKAFDRVNYCKSFRLLFDRGFCPMYSRLLLNMYTNTKLCVRWQN